MAYLVRTRCVVKFGEWSLNAEVWHTRITVLFPRSIPLATQNIGVALIDKRKHHWQRCHHGHSIVHTTFMAFICKLVNVKMQCTHGMIFSLIGMKFHGKFLEANNLYFGKHRQHGGGEGSAVGFPWKLVQGFFLFFFPANEKKWWQYFHWMPVLSCFEKSCWF